MISRQTMYLFIYLWHYQECSPATQLLRLKNISNIRSPTFLPLAPISLEITSEVPPEQTPEPSKLPVCVPMLNQPVVLSTWCQYIYNYYILDNSRKYLSKNSSFTKEARFTSINKSKVKIGMPRLPVTNHNHFTLKLFHLLEIP